MLISFQAHQAPGLKSKNTFVFICLPPTRVGLLDLSLMWSLRHSELKCLTELLFVERLAIKMNKAARLFGQGLCYVAFLCSWWFLNLFQQLDGGKWLMNVGQAAISLPSWDASLRFYAERHAGLHQNWKRLCYLGVWPFINSWDVGGGGRRGEREREWEY